MGRHPTTPVRSPALSQPATSDQHSETLEHSSEEASGLQDAEVLKLREQWGFNELTEESRNPILALLTYFWGPIPWMIEAAAVLSAAIHHWAEFGVIAALLFANALVGFWEEHQAGNTIEALKKKLAPYARVSRNGAWSTIPARDLVPGDLVRIRTGDIVPADVRVVPGQEQVRVDQSALTGESLAVKRSPGEDVYSGSVVKRGEADAVVVATGSHTYFGETAGLVRSTHKRSHFQEAVLRIGRFLILIAVGLVAVIVATSVARGDGVATTLQFALVLTIAGIPVAMPTVLSVTMAVGSKILARNGAVVSRLAAVEELAGIDVLCSDKTGTLTKNQLEVGEPMLLDGVPRARLLRAAAWASRKENDDPIDRAVLAAAEDPDGPEDRDIALVRFVPFDPVEKRTAATLRRADSTTFQVMKGAAQAVLRLASADTDVARKVADTVDAFAARGFRSLAVAETDATGRWVVLGVLPLYDPPRDDAAGTIESAHALGIDVKMVTGDHLAIARETAKQLGMGDNVLRADELPEQSGSLDETTIRKIEHADGFAEVYPEHKHRIVEGLQRHGHIVGMTGDGVNDAPALKRADTGIAVAGATDAARSAADIVLLTPGLSVIIDAVGESRRIFQRMKSYATYRIAETLRVLLFMVASILVFHFYPVTAVMIVLLALLNDGAILAIAYDRVETSLRPEAWNMREVLGVALVLGVFGVIESFGLFWAGWNWFHLDAATLQTLIYLKLSIAGHLTIFVTRTKGPFWSSRPAPVLVGAVLGTQLLATLVAVYGVLMTPIGWTMASIVWAYAIVGFFAEDAAKLATRKLLLPRFADKSEGGGHASVWSAPLAHHS